MSRKKNAMRRPLFAAFAVLALLAACANDGASPDVTAPCGLEGNPCCAGDACNAGLTCTDGRCGPAATLPPDAATDADAAPDPIVPFGQACKPDGFGDCGPGACVQGGVWSSVSGYVCSPPCTSDAMCVAGWTCANANDAVGGRACACAALAPDGGASAETCNGLDDDCDGKIDNGPGPDAGCARDHGAGWKCASGACACAVTCGGGCTDTDSDVANCGGCNKACTPGAGETALCVNGACYAKKILSAADTTKAGVGTTIAATDDDVFWVAGDQVVHVHADGTVTSRMALTTGTSAATTLILEATPPSGRVPSAYLVYSSDNTSTAAVASGIWRFDLGTLAAPTRLPQSTSLWNFNAPFPLAILGSELLVSGYNGLDPHFPPAGGAWFRAKLADGTIGPSIDISTVYPAGGGYGSSPRFESNGAVVYALFRVRDAVNVDLYRLDPAPSPLAAPTATRLANGAALGSGAYALDTDTFYWLDMPSQTDAPSAQKVSVRSSKLTDPGATDGATLGREVLASQRYDVKRLVTTSADTFYALAAGASQSASNAGPSVQLVPKGGAEPFHITPADGASVLVSSLTASAKSAYWIEARSTSTTTAHVALVRLRRQ